MTTRYVTLGDGRKIGLGAYVKAWRACRALPPETPIGRGISGWGENAGQALCELRSGMHDRINRHIPDHGRGRKWSSDWQRSMRQSADRLNHPRLIIDWLPADLLPRFAGRLRCNMD